MANPLLILAAAAAEHAAGHGEAHAEPMTFGFMTPGMWVATSMIVLILVALKLGVPKMLSGGLDSGIAEIRKQLEEAKTLRAEAEALRKEYADKIAGAEKDATAMIEHARHEADAIIAKAETDTADVIVRREKMAQDKIAATERAAVADLRARAANAAATAAKGLIAANHTPAADKALVDQAIGGL
jgi:F-type H+-transporting ATPase subunit b